MGKKGGWFSALKKAFSSGSKEKPPKGPENKNSREKKRGRGMLKHGDNRSFIPLFREPSSIEKILREADSQNLFIRPPTPSEPPRILALPAGPTSAQVALPGVSSPSPPPPRAVSPKVYSPRVDSLTVASSRIAAAAARSASPRPQSPVLGQGHGEFKYAFRTEPTPRNLHLSATRIQAMYRGYLARRSFRALRGLVRLQGVVRGQNVQRQTMNVMKQMQLLVRIQTQIQSRRIQMLENQAPHHQAYRNDTEVESTPSKWTSNQLSEAGNNEEWDDSLLTKEQVEERLRKKVEAAIKRERAMAYAYSRLLWKSNQRSAQTALDFRPNGFPWWWDWIERQLPAVNPSENRTAANNVQLTPARPVSQHKPSPRLQAFESYESGTPRSSKSTIRVGAKPFQTPTGTPSRRQTPNSSVLKEYKTHTAKAADSAFNAPMNDTDSLTSCPPYSAPNYMSPTVSAKARARANSNPKERIPGTPGNDSKRRFSFSLTPNIGSFKWNKGSNQDSAPHKVLHKHESMRSIGEVSVDSAISVPAIVGRKPFNRFV